jgi:hypothetical protein
MTQHSRPPIPHLNAPYSMPSPASPSWPNHVRSTLHRRRSYRPRARFRHFTDLHVELREMECKHALSDTLRTIYFHSPPHHGRHISNLSNCRRAICWVYKVEGTLTTRVLVRNARFFLYMDGDAEALKGWVDNVLGHGVCNAICHLEISNPWSHRSDGLSKDIEFMRGCPMLRMACRHLFHPSTYDRPNLACRSQSNCLDSTLSSVVWGRVGPIGFTCSERRSLHISLRRSSSKT